MFAMKFLQRNDFEIGKITDRALANSCEICLETVMLFLEILVTVLRFLINNIITDLYSGL